MATQPRISPAARASALELELEQARFERKALQADLMTARRALRYVLERRVVRVTDAHRDRETGIPTLSETHLIEVTGECGHLCGRPAEPPADVCLVLAMTEREIDLQAVQAG